MADCFLCGNNRAGISPYWDERLTRLVKCPDCGEYYISEQAATEIANGNFQAATFPLVAGMVFDSFYYKNEIKTVMTEDFRMAKRVTILEKLYLLAKYAYTEYQKGNKEKIYPPPACCYEDHEEYFKLLGELKRREILDFFEATQKGGARGTPTTMVGPIKLTTKAIMAFENGIETAKQFEEVFMDTNKGGDTFNIHGIYGGQNQLGSHNTMHNMVDDAGTFIRSELRKGGVSDQQIAFIEPEIAEISAKYGKGSATESKFKAVLSRIKEKLGQFVYDITVQTISNLTAGKLSGQ